MSLQELKALCENATPGPWEERDLPDLIHNSTSTIHAPNAADVPTWSELPPEIAGVLKARDARLIVAARTALPKLIAAVEAVLAIDVDAVEDEVNGDWRSQSNDWNAGVSSGLRDMHEKITGIINNALEES